MPAISTTRVLEGSRVQDLEEQTRAIRRAKHVTVFGGLGDSIVHARHTAGDGAKAAFSSNCRDEVLVELVEQ